MVFQFLIGKVQPEKPVDVTEDKPFQFLIGKVQRSVR